MTLSEALEKSAQEFYIKARISELRMRDAYADEKQVAQLIHYAMIAASIITKNVELGDA